MVRLLSGHELCTQRSDGEDDPTPRVREVVILGGLRSKAERKCVGTLGMTDMRDKVTCWAATSCRLTQHTESPQPFKSRLEVLYRHGSSSSESEQGNYRSVVVRHVRALLTHALLSLQ